MLLYPKYSVFLCSGDSFQSQLTQTYKVVAVFLNESKEQKRDRRGDGKRHLSPVLMTDMIPPVCCWVTTRAPECGVNATLRSRQSRQQRKHTHAPSRLQSQRHVRPACHKVPHRPAAAADLLRTCDCGSLGCHSS